MSVKTAATSKPPIVAWLPRTSEDRKRRLQTWPTKSPVQFLTPAAARAKTPFFFASHSQKVTGID